MNLFVLLVGVVVMVELALAAGAWRELVERERDLDRLLACSSADPLTGLLYPPAYERARLEELQRAAGAGGHDVQELVLPHAIVTDTVGDLSVGDLVDPSDIGGLGEPAGCRLVLRSAPADEAVARLATLGLDVSDAHVVVHHAGSAS